MNPINPTKSIARLAYDLTYHRYLMNKDKAQNLFTILAPSDYIALHSIQSAGAESAGGKIYLKDLAAGIDVTIHNASRLAGKLRDRGLVVWAHDGIGDEGTYVAITPSGLDSMQRQEASLSSYYSRVIEEFGHENLIALLAQMDALEAVMNRIFEEEGGAHDDAAE